MPLNAENWLLELAEDVLARKSLYPEGNTIEGLCGSNWLTLLRDDILGRGSLYPGMETDSTLTITNFLVKLRDNILERGSLYPEIAPSRVYTNLIQDPLMTVMSSWSSNSATNASFVRTLVDGVTVYTGRDGESITSAVTLIQTLRDVFVLDHSYYATAESRVNVGDADDFRSHVIQLGSAGRTSILEKTTDWATVDCVSVAENNHLQNSYFGVNRYFEGEPLATGVIVETRKPMLIDLTEEFGVGNEPTIEWCRENIPFTTNQ